MFSQYKINNMKKSIIRNFIQAPLLNFVLAFGSIFICLVPKLFGINDSFNIPDAIDTVDHESIKTAALLLLLSAAPTLVDFLLDVFSGHYSLEKNQELKKALVVTSISYVLVALDILSKIGHFPVHITPVNFYLSFEFLVWCARLSTTASLMFAISTRNPELFPAWKTGIVTLSVATYGLLRYVLPNESNMVGVYYIFLFTLRIGLVTTVHCMYCMWIYSFVTLRKWTVNDYGVLFYILVFTFLSIHFICNSINNVFFKSACSAMVNLDRFEPDKTIIDLVIAKVLFSVVPNRLAKIELLASKVRIVMF